MFSLADGMTMSAKKDGIVNMGGFIATRRSDWYEGAKGFCVQYEGYLTYGGMNGRDMNALAIAWMKTPNSTISKHVSSKWNTWQRNWMNTEFLTNDRPEARHLH